MPPSCPTTGGLETQDPSDRAILGTEAARLLPEIANSEIGLGSSCLCTLPNPNLSPYLQRRKLGSRDLGTAEKSLTALATGPFTMAKLSQCSPTEAAISGDKRLGTLHQVSQSVLTYFDGTCWDTPLQKLGKHNPWRQKTSYFSKPRMKGL